MKLNSLFESKESSSEISIKDVFYEEGKQGREGFKVLQNFESLAPNGVALDEWKGELTLEDLPLTSLEGFPKKVNGRITLERLSSLESLEGIGEANEISLGGLKIKNFEGLKSAKWLSVTHCKLESFDGLPNNIQNFFVGNCAVGSFKGFPEFVANFKMIGKLYGSNGFSFSKIHEHIHAAGELEFDDVDVDENSGVLGFLKIKQLYKVTFKPTWGKQESLVKAFEIVNKYLPEGDIIDCQNELIDAGLDKHAKM
jgi:hypothetical protein